jgi:hypothetical protein
MRRRGALMAAVVLAASMAAPALAEHSATTLATLLERAQIEEMLSAYYADFNVAIASTIASGKWPSNTGLGSYYLENGTLEVPGMNFTARGSKQIEGFYRDAAKSHKMPPSAKDYMHYTNLRVSIHGDSATADILWTSIGATNPKATPQIVSMGREHDELVKRNGRWYFKRRIIAN